MERKEASALGLRRYTTGRVCGKGHFGERSTATSRCVQCVREEMFKRRHVDGLRKADSAYERLRLLDPVKRDAKNRRYRERLDRDPEYRALLNKRSNARARRLYAEDPAFRARVRAWHTRPDAIARRKAWCKRRYAEDSSPQRERFRKWHYGVTPEQWHAQLEAQDHQCGNPACSAPVTDSSCLDHCHTTGQLRGILCPQCNLLEGLLDKQMDRLTGLIEYREAGGVWVEEQLNTA